jgi:CheY-like chemotaxis protein
LAISRQLVEVMGGSIRVRSREREGSAFIIRLTLPEASPPAVVEPAAEPTDTSAGFRFEGRTVLLVEDNEVNALIARASLESLGLSVVHAASGEEAVGAFSRRRFDAVLMDCQMPGMDGFQATAEIRRDERERRIRRTPILALTAYALSGDRDMCMSHDMDDYLSKRSTSASWRSSWPRGWRQTTTSARRRTRPPTATSDRSSPPSKL